MVPGIAPKPAVPLMAAQPKKPGHMLVLGTGFVGRYVSERLLAQGWLVRRRSLTPDSQLCCCCCCCCCCHLCSLEFGPDLCLDERRRVSGTCTRAAKKVELEKLGMDVSVFDATRSKYGFFSLMFSLSLSSTVVSSAAGLNSLL